MSKSIEMACGKGLRALRDGAGRLVSRVRKIRLSRAMLGRVGYYAALVCLLALLGSASAAWRRGGAAPVEPEAAATPAPILPVMQISQPLPDPTPAPRRWFWPLEGEIIGAYSPQAPVWSQTLSQWQTHDGIDIAGNPGEAVYACADGNVIDAWRDALWGNVVTIDHGDGWVSTYAGLNTLNLVSPGDSVCGGDVISAVGDSAACEAGLSWHLHFELARDGAPVDFADLIEKDAG